MSGSRRPDRRERESADKPKPCDDVIPFHGEVFSFPAAEMRAGARADLLDHELTVY
jgi:hypothetical protein